MKVLYISYNAANEPVTQSQVIPYLEKLAKDDLDIALLTYEKKSSKDILEFNKTLKKRLYISRIIWHHLRYHKRPSLPATVFDIIQGVVFIYILSLRQKFNIIHARQIVPATICLILRQIMKFKWIFDMRGLVAEEYVGHGTWRENGLKFRLVKIMEKTCLINADFITVLTHRQKDYISALPFLRTRNKVINVIPCCVDLDKFYFSAEKRMDVIKDLGLDKKFILMYLGSLGTCYLLPEMLDYFLYLKKKINNSYFLFVTHSDEEVINRLAKKKGLTSEEFKTMSIPFEEVPRILSVADVGIYFINPYKKFGSSPIKFGEYLACGIPVIINAGIGDSEEIVKKHKIGTIVYEFVPGDYERSLGELLELLRTRSALRQRCREVASQFSLNFGSQRYKQIYVRLSG